MPDAETFNPADWLTLAQVAKKLNYSQGRVYGIIREGKLPAYKRGRHRFFKQSDVAALLVPVPIEVTPTPRKRSA